MSDVLKHLRTAQGHVDTAFETLTTEKGLHEIRPRESVTQEEIEVAAEALALSRDMLGMVRGELEVGREQSPHYFGPDGSGAATGTTNLGVALPEQRPGPVVIGSNADGAPAPVSCVPACPVREALHEIKRRAIEADRAALYADVTGGADGDPTIANSEAAAWAEAAVIADAALAAPCGPPAAPSEAGKCSLLAEGEEANPYVARCGAEFETYEEMAHHERKHQAERGAPPPEAP
jgi:hypothetical protein